MSEDQFGVPGCDSRAEPSCTVGAAARHRPRPHEWLTEVLRLNSTIFTTVRPQVEQVTLERRGRDLYVVINIEQDAGHTEAERVLDHAMDVIDQAIGATDDWHNYSIRVFYPDGTETVSVAVDAIEMFRELIQGGPGERCLGLFLYQTT